MKWWTSRWLRRYNVCLQCRRPRFYPWVGKIPWRRKWQSTPGLLPGKSHGQRSLVGYSPWGRTQLSDFTFTFTFHKCLAEVTILIKVSHYFSSNHHHNKKYVLLRLTFFFQCFMKQLAGFSFVFFLKATRVLIYPLKKFFYINFLILIGG